MPYERVEPVFLTLALTRMREGEALRLRRADNDLVYCLIRIEQQVVTAAS